MNQSTYTNSTAEAPALSRDNLRRAYEALRATAGRYDSEPLTVDPGRSREFEFLKRIEALEKRVRNLEFLLKMNPLNQ